MMIVTILISTANYSSAQMVSNFLRSVFFNENVYKTKTTLEIIRVYDINSHTPVIDSTIYYLTPTSDYIRYKVVQDGDNPYIRVLPRVSFSTSAGNTAIIVTPDSPNPPFTFPAPVSSTVTTVTATPTTITTVTISGSTKTTQTAPANDPANVTKQTETTTSVSTPVSPPPGTDPTNYYFQVVDDLTPNNHYLASQTIMGMPVTMPVKFRTLDKQTNMELDLSLGYAFGYKLKCGNNPYRNKYINLVPLALSLNKDTYKYKQADGTYSKGEESISLTYYSFGITYEYYGLNIGAFMGWDRMFNSEKNWVYQSKPWFSVGVGYKIGKDD